MYLPLMHSEGAADQELSVKLFTELSAANRAWAAAKVLACSALTVFPRAATVGVLHYAKKIALEHAEVVARFGHYPHRNAVMGRTTTDVEAAWLASPDVPAWAKSQAAA